MKKTLFVILILITSLNSYSQTKQESIKELFKLMHQDSLIDETFNSIIPTLINQMSAGGDVKSQSAINSQNEILTTLMQTAKDISKRMINEDLVAIYDKYFTQEEINAYIAFYKTPAGQKYINVTPELTKEIMQIMMQKYMPEIQQAVMKKVDELK